MNVSIKHKYRMYDSFSSGLKELEVWSDREGLAQNLAEAYQASGNLFRKSPSVMVESPLRYNKKVQISRDVLDSVYLINSAWGEVAKQLAMAEDNYTFTVFAPSEPSRPEVPFGATKESFNETLKHTLAKNDFLKGCNLIVECTSKDCLGKKARIMYSELDSPELFDRIIK